MSCWYGVVALVGCGVHVDLFSPAASEPIVLFWFLVIYVHSLLAMHPTGKGAIRSAFGGMQE